MTCGFRSCYKGYMEPTRQTYGERPLQFSLMTAVAAMFVCAIALYLHLQCDAIVCTWYDTTVVFTGCALWLKRPPAIGPTADMAVLLIGVCCAAIALMTTPH